MGAVAAAILASSGLEVLGLGPFDAPALGLTVYSVNNNVAIIDGWWWEHLIIVIAVLFIDHFLVTNFLGATTHPGILGHA